MTLPSTTWDLLDEAIESTIAAASKIEPGIDWALDDDGDLIIPLRYTRGLAGVAQGIGIRLRMFKGEWFLNLNLGLPLLDNDVVTESEALLGQVFDQQKALSAFRRVIAAAPYVKSIQALGVSFDGATRTLVVDWRVESALGVVEDSTEVT